MRSQMPEPTAVPALAKGTRSSLKERGRVKGGIGPFCPVPGRFRACHRLRPWPWWPGALVWPVSWSLPSGVSGRAGQGPGRARPRSGAAGVLEGPGRDPHHGAAGNRGYGGCVFRPGCSLWCGSAWLRSSLRVGPRWLAAGAWGGPRTGQRDQSEARPRRPGAGARPAGDHALPVSGPAHAASAAAVRMDSDLASPSRIT